jgi:hypothetical protein
LNDYSLLRTMFRPGEMLYVPGDDSMYRLTSDDLEYNALGFCALKAEFVSWDGEYLGYDSATFKLVRSIFETCLFTPSSSKRTPRPSNSTAEREERNLSLYEEFTPRY